MRAIVFSFLFPSIVYSMQLDDVEKKKIDVELLFWANQKKEEYRKTPTARFIQVPSGVTFEELKRIIAHTVGVVKMDAITVSGLDEKKDNPELIKCFEKCSHLEKNSITLLNGVVDLTTFLKIYVYDKNRVEYSGNNNYLINSKS